MRTPFQLGSSASSRDRERARARPRAGALVLPLAGAMLLAGCASDPDASLSFSGPDGDTLLGAEELADASWGIETDAETGDARDAALRGLRFELDGAEVEADTAEDAMRYAAEELEDGEHRLTVERTVEEGEPTDVHEWTFAVDATPPELELTSPEGAVVSGEPLTVAGESEPGATVSVGERETTVGEDGSFEVELDEAPEQRLELTATDAAGNTTDDETALTAVPSRVATEEVRGLHVSFHGWANESYRERILGMLEDKRINTVQLDLKDESGQVGYDTEVPLAEEIGAGLDVYDLDEAVSELHELGVHVVGRIVAFRDPVLAEHAWEAGNRDLVIQTPSGEPYAGYGGFTSFANPEVTEYNIDLAEEAAAAGVDGILWDYIRRPDGPAEQLVVPGLSDDAGSDTMAEAIADFTARAEEALEPYGVDHGASVYGIAATRPTQIAQNINAMAEHLDYVSPMVYPSHWGPGEYDVAEPNRQPYDIVHAVLEDFKSEVEGTGARVVPWLEDTEYRAWNRPEQVREQIRATEDRGIDEWLMWDPSVRYTPEAYEPRDG